MRDAKWHEPAQDHHLDMFLLFVCLTHISHATAHLILSGARPAQVFRDILLRDAKETGQGPSTLFLCVQEPTGRVIIVIVMIRAVHRKGLAPRPLPELCP